MEKTMTLFAKLVALLVVVALVAMVKYISGMEYVRTEKVILDEYNGYISFNVSSDASEYMTADVFDIETEDEIYSNVRISDIVYTNTFIGTERLVTYVTEHKSNQKQVKATIYVRYDSFLKYIYESNLSK